MKIIARSALLAVSMAGCAVVDTGDQTWFKEGATAREQDAALAAAEAQAAQVQATPAEKRDIVIRNMTGQGWRLVSKSSAPPPEPENRRPLPPPIKTGPIVR